MAAREVKTATAGPEEGKWGVQLFSLAIQITEHVKKNQTKKSSIDKFIEPDPISNASPFCFLTNRIACPDDNQLRWSVSMGWGN